MNNVEKYLKEMAVTASPQTMIYYTRNLRKFWDWLREQRAIEPTRKLVRDFLVQLQGAGISPSVIAIHKQCISAYCSWLVENEVLQTNPVRDLKFGSYRSPIKKDDCVFTVEEYEKIKAECGKLKLRFDYFLGAVIVGWNTGLRLGDVAHLSFDQINLIDRKISLHPRKTVRFSKLVEIPILPELHEFLSSVPHSTGYVFPRMQSEYEKSNSMGFSVRFSRICVAAGVEPKGFHALRHGFTSRLLNKGVPVSVVSSVTGHTLNVLQRYSHVQFQDKQKIVEAALS